MRLRTSVAALTVIALTPAAMADCRTIAFRFHPEQNDSVSTTGVSTGGAACAHAYWTNALRITSLTIARPPAHGRLEVGALRARYRPAPGFKGVDQYAIRICGNGAPGSGCSTITYNITVE